MDMLLAAGKGDGVDKGGRFEGGLDLEVSLEVDLTQLR